MDRVGSPSRYPTAVRRFCAAIMLFSASLLTSCNSATIGNGDTADIDVLDKVRSLDILPRQSQPVNASQPNGGPRGRPAVYDGTEVTDIPEVRPQPIASGNGFDLNFENTPVATVAKVVLGDILGTGYTIDPRVQGTVSLVSVKPVAKSDIIFVLENALRLSGVVLVRDTAGYRLTPVGDAVSFDVDWMRGQSVGIYPIANSGPEPIIAELEKIMDSGESGLSQNVVKFQAISRLNAILVVSRKPALLRTAATWIKRLDNADTGRTSVHVYRVKYGEARQIARVLSEMFIGGSSSASLDAAGSQIAPGSGLSATSSADRLSLNGNNGGSSSNGFASRSMGGGTGSSGGSGFGATQTAGANNASGSGPLDSGGASPGAGGKPMLQGVRITADTVNNTLLIYADQESYRIIESTLQQVDQPQLQVAIDATIAEVTLTNELAYGVQSYLTSRNLGLRPDQGSALNTQSTSAPAAAAAGAVANAFINRAFPGFNFLVGSEAQPSAILDALHSVTAVKVLSNPSLVVINNQVATLQVGDVVPISTGSATVLTTNNTVVNTIDYRNTGIILRVSPRINVNGNVRLDVEQEISNVSPQTAASLTPTVSERKVRSSISVATGQTVLLAGLISEQQNNSRNGIPLLDQIPGLGDGFSHRDNKTTRTELIIFIRPQIIRDGTDAHFVAEELRSKLRGNLGASIANEPRVPGLH